VIEPRDMAKQQPLDRDTEEADDERRDDQRGPVADAEPIQQKPGAKRAEHILRAMGEVDDVEKAENDGEAEAQHRIERAVDQPDEELREEQRRGRHGDVQSIEHQICPSPALREREGPAPKAWEGEGWCCGNTLTRPRAARSATLSRGAGEGLCR